MADSVRSCVPSQLYHDRSVGYQFDAATTALHGARADTDIHFSVMNVLDKSPPMIATSLVGSPASGFGDPRMRRWSLCIRKSF